MDKIGKFELLKRIGLGAMGAVYEGIDTRMKRRVAVKVLRMEEFGPHQIPDLLARFDHEAEAVGRLSHPNIVTIFEYGEHEGAPYIVMEYLRGTVLGASYALDDTVRIMTQILDALGHAHERGVVHRDLKPSNIFVQEDGSLKLMDFGIAWVEGSQLTKRGDLIGTPAYMSPEQVNGDPVDRRTDLYSAGVILYQLLTGKQPFTGSVISIMRKVLDEEPTEPTKLNPTISPAWDAVVACAMAKNPEARYAWARDFAEAIRRAEQAQRDVTIAIDAKDAERKAAERAAAERARVEAEAAARGEAEVRAKREAEERAARAAEEAKVRAEAEAKAREEARRQEEARRERERAEAEARAKREAEERVAAERAKAEAEAAARREVEERAAREAEERARAEAEARAREEARRQEEERRKEEERRASERAEAEARAKREAEERAAAERAKAEAEAVARGEAEARAKRDAEERAAREAEERARREAEAKARAEAETKAREEARRLEESAQRGRAEAEVNARREAESKAAAPGAARAGPRRAPAIAAAILIVAAVAGVMLFTRQGADDETKKAEAARVAAETVKRETEAKRETEIAAKARADEAAKKAADEKAKALALKEEEEEARKRADVAAKREAEMKAQAEAEAKRKAEEQAKKEADEKAKALALKMEDERKKTEAAARKEADAKAQAEAEAKRKADEQAKKEAEEKAKADAARIAATKPGRVFRDCPDCPQMVVVPAGEFTMGSPASEAGRDADEGPQRQVRIAQAFAMGRNEVTVAEFRRFVEDSGHKTDAERNVGNAGCFGFNYADTTAQKPAWRPGRSWRDPGFEQGDSHPVVCVSWNDARAYVRWLARKTGKTYRLPTEAEWEYATRTGTTAARYWGEDPNQACRHANVADQSTFKTFRFEDSRHQCNDGYFFTAPVTSFAANKFGLFDMLGNVWEWTEDCWNGSYSGAPSDGSAWLAGDCSRRVVRGGGWDGGPRGVRSANRGGFGTAFRDFNLGFRLARTLE